MRMKMSRVKKKEHEKLSGANITHVINLLNPTEGKAITKKEACSILNISYNTIRLGNIIEDHLEKEAFVEKRKAQNKGKRASAEEIKQVIQDYLRGDPISEISKSLFRSAGFVKGILDRVGIPQRPTATTDRAGISLLPEQCRADSFKEGELVWSAKYHAPAIIKRWYADYEDKYASDCYQIYVMEKVDSSDSFFPYVEHGGFNAFALAYDLGKLEHLEEFGVDLSKNIS